MARTSRKSGPPARVTEVLTRYLKRAGLADRVAQAAVVTDWAELVGREIARVAHPEAVTRDGTLFVQVKSAAWRQELSLMTPEIMAKINAGRKQGRIEKIRWVIG